MAGFRSGWPGSFQLEPLDRYADTERKRATSLIKMTIAQKQEAARRKRESEKLTLAPVPEPTEKKGGGGAWAKFKGGLDAVTPDALEAPAKTLGTGTLKALDAPRKYVGAPIAGVLSGRMGAEQQFDANGNPYREVSGLNKMQGWRDLGNTIKEVATQSPTETYREGKQAWEEGQRDPNLSAWKRTAGDAVADPLNLVPLGAVAKTAKFLPAGVRASRGIRLAGSILEQGPRTIGMTTAGSALGAEAADRLGAPEWVGQIAGGIGGGFAAVKGPKPPGMRTQADIASPRSAPGGRPIVPTSSGKFDIKAAPENPASPWSDRDLLVDGAKQGSISRAGKLWYADIEGVMTVGRTPEMAAARMKDTLVPNRPSAMAKTRMWFHSTPGQHDTLDPEFGVGTAVGVTQGPGVYLASDPKKSAGVYGNRTFMTEFDGEVLDLAGTPDTALWEEVAKGLGVQMPTPQQLDQAKRTAYSTVARNANGLTNYHYRDAIARQLEAGYSAGTRDAAKSLKGTLFEKIGGSTKASKGDLALSEIQGQVGKKYDAVFHHSPAADGDVLVVINGEKLRTVGLVDGSGKLDWNKASGVDDVTAQAGPNAQVFDGPAQAPPIDTAAATPGMPSPGAASAVPPPAAGSLASSPAAGGPPMVITTPAAPLPPAVVDKEDLFDTISGPERLAEEAAFRQTIRGKTEAGLKGAVRRKGSDVKTFLNKEATRIRTIRMSREAQADDIYVKATRGLPITKDADGVNRMPNGATFEDMFEQSTPEGMAAYAALTPEQKANLNEMYDFAERLNSNLRYHNDTGRLPWDDSEKNYFPRTSVGVDGKRRAYVASGGGSKLGGKKGFQQERTFTDSFEEGLKEGINYADSRQAWRMMTRAKLKAAENSAMVSRLKPMGIKKSQLPPGRGAQLDYRQVNPTLAPQLNGTYFPVEVADEIEGSLRADPSVVVKAIDEFNKRATPIRAMADISFLFQQGSPLIFRYPQKAPKALLNVIRSTKDRKHYDEMIESVGFNKDEAIKHGLIWGGDDLPATDFALREASTTGRITGKPGVKQVLQGYNKVADFSNETFYRYMNFMKANFVKDAQERLEKMRPKMSDAEWRKEYQGAMNAINRLGGQTGRQATSVEKLSLFAPQYFSATVEQLSKAVTPGGGIEGSIARAHLGRMLFFGAAMVIGVNTLRGKETTVDPRSSNFLRFRDVGGLDVSPFGTYDTLFRAIAGTAMGDPKEGEKSEVFGLKFNKVDFSNAEAGDYTKLWKLAEGKMSPALKLVYEPFIKKANYRGEPYDPGSYSGLVDIAKDQAASALPFSVQNVVDEGVAPAIEERSLDPLADALPGIIASGGGATNSPVTPTENRNWRADKVANEMFGKDYEDLTGREKSIVNEDEQVAKFQEEADKNTETLMDDRSVNRRATLEADSKLDALSQRLESKEIPGSEFRKGYRDIQQQQRGVRSVLEQMEGDKDVEGYFNVFTMAEREDGSIDYELLDQLLPEFVAKHPGVEEKIDAITGTRDNDTLRRFRVAQQQARDYYALPAYRGLSVDEGKRAQPILATARRLVNNNQAAGYKHALRQMLAAGAITRDDMILAIKAQKLGTSAERKQFRLTHPEYAEFYGDAVLDEDYAAVGTYGDGGGSRARSLSGGSIVKLPTPPKPKVGLSLRTIG